MTSNYIQYDRVESRISEIRRQLIDQSADIRRLEMKIEKPRS